MLVTLTKSFSKVPARPGPSHGSKAHGTRTIYRPARQSRGLPRGFDGPAHVLSRTKRCMCIRCRGSLTLIVGKPSRFFFPVCIPWDSCFRPMRHITSTHYSHNPAPPTTRSDSFLWTTTSSSCCNVLVDHDLLELLQRLQQQHQQQQQHVLLQHPLSSKDNASKYMQ